jgi:carboxyl-terminal processing protease
MNLLKNKRRGLFIWLPVGLILLSIVGFKSVDFKTSKSLDIFFSFFRELSIFYVDKTDPEKLIHIGIDAILESLDPYNELITEANIEAREFQTTGEYGGMGALIRHSTNFPLIAEVYEGSPAHKAGLMAGDIIHWINGVYVKETAVDKVSKMLKGAPNSDLKITIMRLGQPDSLSFEFKREKIHIPSVPYYGMISDEIGYIRLANFTNNSDKEVEKALKEIKANKSAKGLILDLRGNPGGLLFEAVKILNLFVEKNQLVVYTQGQIKEFDQEYKTPSKPIDTEIPLIILVDRISASASEIVAGALQDLDRAVIVGERTFGKGLVQATRPLPYNTQFKVTTAKYYIPSGRCIQAVDYTQRNEDGSISFIPDSLISEFKTQNGRTVYDGGGITPDIANQKSTYSRIASILYANNIYFDYATQFRANNSSIESPSIFSLSDAEYEDFVSYLSTVDFEYQSQTELLVNELASTAKQEKYYDLTHELIDSLASLIKENPLKDLQFFRSEIQSLLEDEIVSRYYYQSGKVRHNIKNDDLIPLSIEILNDKSKYINILSKSSEIFAKDSLQANHTNNKSISWGYHQASSSNSQAVNKKVLLPS